MVNAQRRKRMTPVSNPFKFGIPVSGNTFVNRKKELAELDSLVRNGKSIVLYSDRRMGKSSLIMEFARTHSEKYIFVVLDLYGLTNKNQVLSNLVGGTIGATYSKAGLVLASISELLRGSTFRLTIGERGEIGIDLTRRSVDIGDMDWALNFPEKIASKKGKKLVVVFDEFQELARLDGTPFIKRMRACYQWHKNVTYIFSGSKRHILHQIFEEYEGAFYKFARSMELGPISSAELEDFLKSKFREVGGTLDDDIAAKMVAICDCHPFYTQHLAHELIGTSLTPTADDLQEAVRLLIFRQAPAFSNTWESIESQIQRSYLVALAQHPGAVPDLEFIDRYNLVSRSHVQKAEGGLERKGLISKRKVIDPVFALWLRRLTIEPQW
jgi:hypothetical protein